MTNERNWYAIYVRPKSERRILEILAKKKINSYTPRFSKSDSWEQNRKSEEFPIFHSVVFVHLTEVELKMVKEINGAVNILFWLGKPAVIKDEEIKAIQHFTQVFDHIEIEKIDIKTESLLFKSKQIGSTEINHNGKSDVHRINLYSLGYALIAYSQSHALKSVA